MAIGPHWPDPAKKIIQFPHRPRAHTPLGEAVSPTPSACPPDAGGGTRTHMASLHRLDKTPRRNPIHKRRVYLFRHARKNLIDRKPWRDFKVQLLLSFLGQYLTRSKCECEAFAPNFHITTNSPSRLRGCELCAGKHAWLCRKKLVSFRSRPLCDGDLQRSHESKRLCLSA